MRPPSTPDKADKESSEGKGFRAHGDPRIRSLLASFARVFVLLSVSILTFGAGFALQVYLYCSQGLPSVAYVREKTKDLELPEVTKVFAENGELVAEFGRRKRYFVPLEDIPQALRDAVVAAEGPNFWKPARVKPEEVLREAERAFENFDIGVICYRVVSGYRPRPKNLRFFSNTGFSSILREALFYQRVENAFTKEEILAAFLNTCYLGGSAYGVGAAARTYFGKSVKDLTIAECAMIAGLVSRPSGYSPRRDMKKALERRNYVLKRMWESRMITRAEYEQATRERPILHVWTNPYSKFRYFNEHVRLYVAEKYGADALYQGGLTVYTTLDPALTAAAKDAVRKGLMELDKRQGFHGVVEELDQQGARDFLAKQSRKMDRTLRFGDVTRGVVTHIDEKHIYVRMGSYRKTGKRKDYVGTIAIDPSPDWWVRKPYYRSELRGRDFAAGDLPFRVGDAILVRLIDPNAKTGTLHPNSHSKQDAGPDNRGEVTDETLTHLSLEPEQQPRVQAVLMLRENRTGFVRVLVDGSVSSDISFKQPIFPLRKAGSSFQPVIYAAALEKGYSLADTILRPPEKSSMVPAVKTMKQLGIEYTQVYARKMGYTVPLCNDYRLALGSTRVSMDEHVSAFSVFPNGGYVVPNIYIKKIIDRHGKVLEEHLPPVLLEDGGGHSATSDCHQTCPMQLKRRIKETTARSMTSMLHGLAQRNVSATNEGIIRRKDIAGMAGTSEGDVDSWFMGFSPNYTCGVWVGFDDEHTLGKGETGDRAAAPIWGDFMKEVIKGTPAKESQRFQ